jgi:hypothetical protein
VGFNDLQLPLGTRLTLQTFGSGGMAHHTWLCGVIEDVSLIVHNPVSEGNLVTFAPGQKILLKAFSGTRVVSFETAVITAQDEPTPYIHLEYPGKAVGAIIRSRKRITVELLASAALLSGDGKQNPPCTVKIVDISSDGARVRADGVIANVGQQIGLAFRVRQDLGEHVFRLRGIVRAVTPEDGVFAHGIQFVHADLAGALALEGYAARAAQGQAIGQDLVEHKA